jgi:hypothetical protein
MLLWAGAALATPTAQQSCDKARVAAWAKYVSCVDAVVAKDYVGASFDEYAAFAKCRHTYFKNWTTFQSKLSLVGSTCIGTRYANKRGSDGDGQLDRTDLGEEGQREWHPRQGQRLHVEHGVAV